MSDLWNTTGQRIYDCRIKLGLSQEQLSEKIEEITGRPLKRQTVSGWENGRPIKKLEQLRALCDIFQCDMAYLLCECKTKRVIAQSVSDALGISDTAVNNLVTAARSENPYIRILSAMLENENLLLQIARCVNADYGTISTYVKIPDPLHNKTNSILISPELIKQSELMVLYNGLVNFIIEMQKNMSTNDT